MNLSHQSDEATARTDPECAAQRAAHIAILGGLNVLELCVGPSLAVLSRAYADHGISVTGNDIDPRWRRAAPEFNWIVGDALEIDWAPFDTVVFAPPLTEGCTGRREDALLINEIEPSYRAFIERPFDGLRVMVLPARALSTSEDRRQLHFLLAMVPSPFDFIALSAGPRKIRKYVDVYFRTGPEAARSVRSSQ